jgi:hypothetical protein
MSWTCLSGNQQADAPECRNLSRSLWRWGPGVHHFIIGCHLPTGCQTARVHVRPRNLPSSDPHDCVIRGTFFHLDFTSLVFPEEEEVSSQEIQQIQHIGTQKPAYMSGRLATFSRRNTYLHLHPRVMVCSQGTSLLL